MVTLNRPLHTIWLSRKEVFKEVFNLLKLPYWNKSHSFIHIPPTQLHFFCLRTFNQFYKTLLSVMVFSTKYNTYLGQPKSIHDWVFFWSHYICGYWKVYYSVYHSQPLESCCQSKRKPWEMFSHQQETTYNICKSSIQRNLHYMQADTVCIQLVALICVKSSDLSCHLCLLCYYDQLVLFNKEIHANIYRHSL